MKNTMFRVLIENGDVVFVGMRSEGGAFVGEAEALVSTVYVRSYFDATEGLGAESPRTALFSEILRLASCVKFDTSFDAERILVGRFTFMELLAYNTQARDKDLRPDVLKVNADTLFLQPLGSIPIVLTPGPNHFIEAVPPAQWMLGGLEVKRYRVEKPDT